MKLLISFSYINNFNKKIQKSWLPKYHWYHTQGGRIYYTGRGGRVGPGHCGQWIDRLLGRLHPGLPRKRREAPGAEIQWAGVVKIHCNIY